MPEQSSLSPFLRPQSVVFIGASSQSDTYAGRPLAYTRNWGYQGSVYVVNPSRDEVGGERSYASVREIDAVIDLAVILLSAERAVAAVRDCAEHGVRSCLVIASGFAEAGADGAKAQAEMAATARAAGMRLIGPNSAGIVNLDLGLVAKSAYLFRERFDASGLAFITQSGSLSTVLLLELKHLGVSARYVIDTGNEADVNAVEVIGGLLEDPGVRVIAGYVEAFSAGEQLLEIGRQAMSAGVPLVLLAPANPIALSDAVASHTGAMVRSSQGLRDAVLRQAGILATPSTQIFTDAIASYVTLAGRAPAGPRVGIVSGSGGAGILLADACLRAGLEVEPVAGTTADALRRFLPAYAALRNPIDITGSALDHPEWLEQAVQCLVDDPGIDSVIVNFGRHHGSERVLRDAEALVALSKVTDKPILACTVRTDANQAAIDALRSGGVPVFVDNETCALVLGSLCDRRARTAVWTQPSTPAAALAAATTFRPDEHGVLDDGEIFAMLEAYDVPVAPYRIVADASEAVAAAEQLGYPVAMKVLSSEISHKTEAGGVRLGIAGSDAIGPAWQALQQAVGVGWSGRALVQAMTSPGLEVIIGLSRHTDVGAVVMVGAGGTLVEVVRDVAFAGLPVTTTEVDHLIDSTVLGSLVNGVRGGAALDRGALVKAIAAAARLFMAETWISEMDLNPLILGPAGACVVDALVVLERPQ